MREARKTLGVFLLLLSSSLAVYWPALKGDFVFDDRSLVVENVEIRRLETAPRLFTHNVHRFSPQQKTRYYRPFQTLTYAFDHALWGMNPFGYHLTNVVTHALVALLVYLLLVELAFAPATALLAALFWALHPVHAMLVSYVAGRADLLAAFFLLAGSLAFARFLKKGRKGAFVAAHVALAAALLSRENALLGPLAFLCAGWASGARFSRTLRASWGFFALALVYLALRVHFWGAGGLTLTPASHPAFPNLLNVLRHYAMLVVMPWPLYPMHAIPWVYSIGPADVLFVVSVAMLAGACLLIDRRQGSRRFSFAVLWTAVFLLPLGGLIHSFPRLGALMSESWFYMPAIGVAALAAPAFARFGRAGFLAAAAALVFGGAVLFSAAGVWKDELVLYRHTLRFLPHNPNVRVNLANALHERGDHEAAARLAQAVLDTEPREGAAHVLLGNARFAQRNWKAASAAYERALDLWPDNARALTNLGLVRKAEGRDAEALVLLEKAVRLDDSLWAAWRGLGELTLHRGDFRATIAAYERAFAVGPSDSVGETYYGIALGSLGRAADAEKAFRRALAADPRSAVAMKNLGVTYANLGKRREAAEWWKTALEVTPDDAELRRYLEDVTPPSETS